MKYRFWGKFSLGFMLAALILTIPFLGGCPAKTPSSPAATPTPPPNQTLWKNGAIGSFLGNPLTINLNTASGVVYESAVTNSTITDTITGDTTVLALNTTAGCPSCGENEWNLIIPGVPSPYVNASAFYSTGHIQFDIMCNCNTSSLTVAYQGSDYTISTSSLSFSSFQHVSIPFSAFTSNVTSNVNDPFSILANAESCGNTTVFFIDNVQWTGN